MVESSPVCPATDTNNVVEFVALFKAKALAGCRWQPTYLLVLMVIHWVARILLITLQNGLMKIISKNL